MTFNRKTPELHINGRSIIKDINHEAYSDVDDALEQANEVFFSQPTSPSELTAVQKKIMEINRYFIAQIEILKWKVQIDTDRREIAKKEIQDSTNRKLKSKEMEVKSLKSDLQRKEENMKILDEDNQHKTTEIIQLQHYITELKNNVLVSNKGADDMQRQLDLLPKSPTAEKDIEICRLRAEVDNLKTHLHTLEEELAKATERIAEQGGRIRVIEIEKNNFQIKFKEDLAKVNRVVRIEIEKLRDVMSEQCMEMRGVRAENSDIKKALQEVKSILEAQKSSPSDQRNSREVSEVESTPGIRKEKKKNQKRKN